MNASICSNMVGPGGNLHVCVLSSQSCLTLRDPMDCSLSGSSVHGILQVRILEWITMPSSRESSRPRDGILTSYVSCIGSELASQLAPLVKNLSVVQEALVRFLDREDLLEKR